MVRVVLIEFDKSGAYLASHIFWTLRFDISNEIKERE